jgi:hypothetical protein
LASPRLLPHVEALIVADATMNTFYKKDPERILAGASSSTRFLARSGRIFFIMPGRVSVAVGGGPGMFYAHRSKFVSTYHTFQKRESSKLAEPQLKSRSL